MKLRHILALPILWLVLVGQSDARPQTNPLTGNNLSIVTAEITSKAHELAGESVVDPEGHAPKVTIDIRPNDDRYGGHTALHQGPDRVGLNLSKIWDDHAPWISLMCNNAGTWELECPEFNAKVLLELAAISLMHEFYHVKGVGGGKDPASSPHIAIEYTQALALCGEASEIIDTYPPQFFGDQCNALARLLAIGLYSQRRQDMFTNTPYAKGAQQEANARAVPAGQQVPLDQDGNPATPPTLPGSNDDPVVEYPEPDHDSGGNVVPFSVDNSFLPTCDISALCD